MDLSAYNLQKLNREKRERQPNWTESEKQLLLSLTRIHRHVLENKGSDTMTIKRKSEAWDEIALRMNAAGFNRSKERLKQQLGRIRAAEAKRVKDALERSLPKEENKILNMSINHSTVEEKNSRRKLEFDYNQNEDSPNNSNSFSPTPPLEEHQYIKSEETTLIDQKVCSEQELVINSSTNTKANFINYTIVNACKNNKNTENSKILKPNNMSFRLQNVQSLGVMSDNASKAEVFEECNNELKRTCAADVTSTIPCSRLSSNLKTSGINFESKEVISGGCDENAACSITTNKYQTQQVIKHRLSNIRLNRIRPTFTREQSLRQVYMYRAAVERERLRSLRLQQKRDRILYRKDIEIQNLKLQILRNLTNQNRDGNSINL